MSQVSRRGTSRVAARSLVLASAMSVLASASAGATRSGCGQQITFLGVSAGNPPIAWITEDIGGACVFSFLVQVAIEPDTVRASVTPLDLFADWEWLVRGQIAMRAYEPPDTTGADDGDTVGDTGDGAAVRAQAPDTPVIRHRRPPDAAPHDRLPTVEAPPASDEWHTAFLAHIDAGGSDAVTWNEEMGSAGILPPIVDGAEAKVLYAYDHGLYVNYVITRVERLPYGHLLVLTTQPALGLLNNTMHGFLVVRGRR